MRHTPGLLKRRRRMRRDQQTNMPFISAVGGTIGTADVGVLYNASCVLFLTAQVPKPKS